MDKIEISPDVAVMLHGILVQQSISVGSENFADVAVLVSRALHELAPALETVEQQSPPSDAE